MDNLQKAPSNVAKMALVYGTFGLGKSQENILLKVM